MLERAAGQTAFANKILSHPRDGRASSDDSILDACPELAWDCRRKAAHCVEIRATSLLPLSVCLTIFYPNRSDRCTIVTIDVYLHTEQLRCPVTFNTKMSSKSQLLQDQCATQEKAPPSPTPRHAHVHPSFRRRAIVFDCLGEQVDVLNQEQIDEGTCKRLST